MDGTGMRLLLQGRRSLTIGQNNLVFYGTTQESILPLSATHREHTNRLVGIDGGNRPRLN